MTTTRNVSFIVATFALAACSSSGDDGHGPSGAGDVTFARVVSERGPGNVLASFNGHFDAKTRKVTFTPIAGSGTGVSPQGFKLDAANLFTLNSIDGDFGGVAAGPCPSDSATTFCTDVQVTNTTSGSPLNDMPDVYVEITSLTLGSVANSDSPKVGYNPPLLNTIGQFYYGSIAASGTGTKLWKFNDPGQADFTFSIDVLYTHAHTTFGHAGPTVTSSVDACATGAVLLGPGGGNTDSGTSLTFGFPVSIYGKTSTSALVTENGFIELSGLVSTGANVALNNPASPFGSAGVILPFWDDLSMASLGTVCEQTVGASPSRTHVVTWKNMDIVSTGTVEQLTFSAVIHEGSDTIDFVYLLPSTGITNATRGSGATVGIEGPVSGSKTTHQISFNAASLPSTAAGYPAKYTLTGN